MISNWGFVLDAEMPEVTGNLVAVCDSCYNCNLPLTMPTQSHIELEEFSQHFDSARDFDGALNSAGDFEEPTFLFRWFLNNLNATR